MMLRASLCIALLTLTTGAQAASSDAWARFQLSVAEGCAAASKLDHAHISEIVGFDDSLGKVVALVTGRTVPRRGVPAATIKKLCVYDKRSRHIWIDEAAGWSAPDLR
jgi:hypothetical protein